MSVNPKSSRDVARQALSRSANRWGIDVLGTLSFSR